MGWGFQLQEPMFVVILTVLLFLLGLSLFGVFEVRNFLDFIGEQDLFSKGLSSCQLIYEWGFGHTRCHSLHRSPLGPALGFGMTLPTLQALAIFTAMGLGMASPYLLFSAFPHLVRFLPKPGNWMVVFKQTMGFLMMATVIWLLWVFGAQTDNMATFILMVSLLIIAIGAWIFGKWGSFTRKRMTRTIATILAAILIFTSSFGAVMAAKKFRGTFPTDNQGIQLVSDSGWETYSPERVKDLQSRGVAVFVDFTAKWCLICQANKVILHSADVENAFHEKGVVTMVADWTKRDPVISKELEKLGRSGVPVYVLYPGNAQESPSSCRKP